MAWFGFATIAISQTEKNMTIHQKHMDWINGRGITADLAQKLGLFTASDGQGHWLAVPYRESGQVINHKYRMTQEKRHRMDQNAPLLFWNHDCLLDDRIQSGEFPVIITEGEWDAMSFMEAGFWNVVSVPNGAPQKAVEAEIGPETDAERFRFLWRSRALLDQVGTFILATDADEPGRILANELARRLGPERCKFVTFPKEVKDANELLQLGDRQSLRELIDAAKVYPIKSLYRMSEFPDPPELAARSLGIVGLSDKLPFVRSAFTVVSGFAGSGKTSLITNIVAQQMKAGRSVVMGSFETMPKPILQRKLRAALIGCPDNAIPVPKIEWADEIIERHFTLIANNTSREDEMDLEEMLELCRVAVLRDGCEMVIIDPWNELEHRRENGENELEYTGRAIRRMKRFMRDYDVALWVVAHPRKPDMSGGQLRMPSLYDISGSAHFANKADYGLMVWRPDKQSNVVEAHVTKVRMGYPGGEGVVKLAYDWRFSSYSPAEVEDCEA